MNVAKTELSRADFSEFRDFVNNRVGLHITSTKKKHLERCLIKRMSNLGHTSPKDYLRFIRNIPQNHVEMKELVNLLTVGETYFFRDHNQLNVVKKKILKPLIEKRNITAERRLKIWSAGCASGEEPYSLAMIIKELIPYLNFWKIDILATDINHHSLEKAKSASYNNWSFRNTSEHIKDKYFIAKDSKHHLVDEIKKMVSFNYLNLVDPCYPSYFNRTTDIDLIICRNVAIYFNRETTRSIVERFYECLSDEGWLVMGASDPFIADSRFKSKELSGLYIYYKSRKLLEQKVKKTPPKLKKKVKIERQTEKLSAIMPLRFEPSEEADQYKLSRKDSSADSYRAGMHLFHSGALNKALDKFHLGFKEKKKTARCAYMIAKIEANRGDLDEAKKWSKKAVVLDKLLLEGHFLLSMIYQGLGKDQLAIDSMKKTIYLNHNFAEGYFCLGVIYKKQGNKKMAVKAFQNVKKLLKDKPAVKEIPELKGISYSKLLKCVQQNIDL